MKNSQNGSNLDESLSSILKEEINNLKQIYAITIKIEETLQKNKIDKLEDLIQKRGAYIQSFVELRNKELNLKEQDVNNSHLSYLVQERKDILHQIESVEIKTGNMLKQQMKEVKRNLSKAYDYQELRKTYIKEGGKFFDEAFFVDKKS